MARTQGSWAARQLAEENNGIVYVLLAADAVSGVAAITASVKGAA